MSTARDPRRFLGHFLDSTPFLKAFLLASVGRLADAEDLLQEVSAVLWEKFDAYDETRPFRAWALGVARVEVLRWRRRQARSRELLSPETVELLADAALEEADAAGPELGRRLEACLEKAGDAVRSLLRWRYGEDLSMSALAERSGKSQGAVEMALVRARRALRDCMDRRAAAEEGA